MQETTAYQRALQEQTEQKEELKKPRCKQREAIE